MQTGETTIRAPRGQLRRRGHHRQGTVGPARESRGRAGPALHGRDGRAAHGRDAHATGFTLTEIMIAMGVLAIGMAMVAGAMHAGIQVHIRTIDDIMRQLIGDNTLAIVQARVRHTANANNLIPTDKYQLLGSNYFGPGDLTYPSNTTGTPYGAAVFMKRRAIDANSSANDYDVLIVPYRLVSDSTTTTNSTVAAADMTPCTVSAGSSGGSMLTLPAGCAGGTVKVGSAIIDNRNGQVSLVKSLPETANTVELADVLTAGNKSGVTLTALTVSAGSNDRLECSKPVQTKTALSPAVGTWIPGDN